MLLKTQMSFLKAFLIIRSYSGCISLPCAKATSTADEGIGVRRFVMNLSSHKDIKRFMVALRPVDHVTARNSLTFPWIAALFAWIRPRSASSLQ